MDIAFVDLTLEENEEGVSKSATTSVTNLDGSITALRKGYFEWTQDSQRCFVQPALLAYYGEITQNNCVLPFLIFESETTKLSKLKWKSASLKLHVHAFVIDHKTGVEKEYLKNVSGYYELTQGSRMPWSFIAQRYKENNKKYMSHTTSMLLFLINFGDGNFHHLSVKTVFSTAKTVPAKFSTFFVTKGKNIESLFELTAREPPTTDLGISETVKRTLESVSREDRSPKKQRTESSTTINPVAIAPEPAFSIIPTVTTQAPVQPIPYNPVQTPYQIRPTLAPNNLSPTVESASSSTASASKGHQRYAIINLLTGSKESLHLKNFLLKSKRVKKQQVLTPQYPIFIEAEKIDWMFNFDLEVLGLHTDHLVLEETIANPSVVVYHETSQKLYLHVHMLVLQDKIFLPHCEDQPFKGILFKEDGTAINKFYSDLRIESDEDAICVDMVNQQPIASPSKESSKKPQENSARTTPSGNVRADEQIQQLSYVCFYHQNLALVKQMLKQNPGILQEVHSSGLTCEDIINNMIDEQTSFEWDDVKIHVTEDYIRALRLYMQASKGGAAVLKVLENASNSDLETLMEFYGAEDDEIYQFLMECFMHQNLDAVKLQMLDNPSILQQTHSSGYNCAEIVGFFVEDHCSSEWDDKKILVSAEYIQQLMTCLSLASMPGTEGMQFCTTSRAILAQYMLAEVSTTVPTVTTLSYLLQVLSSKFQKSISSATHVVKMENSEGDLVDVQSDDDYLSLSSTPLLKVFIYDIDHSQQVPPPEDQKEILTLQTNHSKGELHTISRKSNSNFFEVICRKFGDIETRVLLIPPTSFNAVFVRLVVVDYANERKYETVLKQEDFPSVLDPMKYFNNLLRSNSVLYKFVPENALKQWGSKHGKREPSNTYDHLALKLDGTWVFLTPSKVTHQDLMMESIIQQQLSNTRMMTSMKAETYKGTPSAHEKASEISESIVAKALSTQTALFEAKFLSAVEKLTKDYETKLKLHEEASNQAIQQLKEELSKPYSSSSSSTK